MKEALKLAREHIDGNFTVSAGVALAAIDKALAQPEQEPVAVTAEMARAFHRAISDGPLGQADEFEIQTGLEAAFAHITTPPQRTWVGLTDEDLAVCGDEDDVMLARYWERVCKEKNT